MTGWPVTDQSGTHKSGTIQIKELKKLFKILIDHAEEHLTNEPELPYTTFFVTMFSEGLKMEPEMTMAHLEDDITYLKKALLEKPNTMTALDYERLGNIIKAMGHRVYNK